MIDFSKNLPPVVVELRELATSFGEKRAVDRDALVALLERHNIHTGEDVSAKLEGMNDAAVIGYMASLDEDLSITMNVEFQKLTQGLEPGNRGERIKLVDAEIPESFGPGD